MQPRRFRWIAWVLLVMHFRPAVLLVACVCPIFRGDFARFRVLRASTVRMVRSVLSIRTLRCAWLAVRAASIVEPDMSVKTRKDWTAMSRLFVSWTTAAHRRRVRMRALGMQVAKWTLVKWMVARTAPDPRQMQVPL